MASFNHCEVCGQKFQLQTKIHKGAPLLPNQRFCPSCLAKIQMQQQQQQIAKRAIRPQITFKTGPTPFDASGYNIPNIVDCPDKITYYIVYTILVGASDLHLKSKAFPFIRKSGKLYKIDDYPLTSEEIFDFIKRKYKSPVKITDRMEAYDFTVEFQSARFRCNAFSDANGWCISFRLLALPSTDFDKLGIPNVLKEIAVKKSGLILITGPTGSGKTTTLTCLIDYMNKTMNRHIITLEDPIEFIHHNNACLISQREIGRDSKTYEDAVIESLREDPDVIMIGEMRDQASIESALRAAETGHIVLSTLHTRDSVSTINRIVDIFPAEQQSQIRTQLAMSLLCVISQQLIPSTTEGELALATEVMICNDATRAIIRESRLHMMGTTLQTSSSEGMYTMKASLENLYAKGRISETSMYEYMIR